MEKELSIYDLEQRLEAQINTMDEDYSIAKGDGYEDRRQEALTEIIDGLVPIYNHDLLTVCGSNLWLGEEESGTGARNAFECLREAIYEYLRGKADELISK